MTEDVINFEEALDTPINFNQLGIRDLKKGKNYTGGILTIDKKITNKVIEMEGDYTSIDLINHAWHEINNFISNRVLSVPLTPISPLSRDLANTLDLAQPMKQEDPLERLQKNGFVRGMVLNRRNSFDDFYTSCGIFTGEFGRNSDGITVKFTDGSTFLAEFCSPIEDINKNVMRLIDEESRRLQSDVNELIETIHYRIHCLIHDDERMA